MTSALLLVPQRELTLSPIFSWLPKVELRFEQLLERLPRLLFLCRLNDGLRSYIRIDSSISKREGFIIFRFCCYLADLKMCFFLSPNVYWRWLLNDSFIIMNLPTYKLLFFSKDSLLLPILTANSIFYLYSWSSPRGGEWRLISSFFSVLPSKFCRIL